MHVASHSVQYSLHTRTMLSCQEDDYLDPSDRLCSPISAEEIGWALQKVKKDARQGFTSRIVYCGTSL